MSLLIKALKRAERKHDEAKLAAQNAEHSHPEAATNSHDPLSRQIGLQAFDTDDTELAFELARLQIDQNERSEGDLPDLPEALELTDPPAEADLLTAEPELSRLTGLPDLPALQLDDDTFDTQAGESASVSPAKPRPALTLEGLSEPATQPRSKSTADSTADSTANTAAASASKPLAVSTDKPTAGNDAAARTRYIDSPRAGGFARVMVYSGLSLAALLCVGWLTMDFMGLSVSKTPIRSGSASLAPTAAIALPVAATSNTSSSEGGQPSQKPNEHAGIERAKDERSKDDRLPIEALNTTAATAKARSSAPTSMQATKAHPSSQSILRPASDSATTSSAKAVVAPAATASSLLPASEQRLAGLLTTPRDASTSPASAPATVSGIPQATGGTPNGVRLARSETFTEQTLKMNEQAWQLLSRNEKAAARSLYEQVLRLDRNNGDAWLGLASLASKAGDAASADMHYRKALEIDPNDAAARAGVLSLRSNHEPNAQESRLRHLLEQGGGQPALLFALGNTLAAQARWADAQQAYFSAYTADSGNADYAFNLAVTLERLRQPQAAANFYRTAMELAERRPAQFDRQIAERRMAALQAPRPTKPADSAAVSESAAVTE